MLLEGNVVQRFVVQKKNPGWGQQRRTPAQGSLPWCEPHYSGSCGWLGALVICCNSPSCQVHIHKLSAICLISGKVGTIRPSEHSYCFGCNKLARLMDHLRRRQGGAERSGDLLKLPATTAGRMKNQEQLVRRGKVMVVLLKR